MQRTLMQAPVLTHRSSPDLSFRIESIKLKFMMVNGKKEAGLIVSAGKDGLIKYWDIEQ